MDVFSLVKSNNIAELKKFISYGDINQVNSKRMSLLMFAIICNNINAFTLLIDNYIDVNMQDINGYTALHYSIINNRLGFTKTLLRHGAKLDLKNVNMESPLFKACILGREEIISLILEQHEMNFFEENIYKDNIFNALIRSHSLKLVKLVPITKELLLHKNVFGETPLHISTKINDLPITEYLLDNGAYPNLRNNDLETPIFNSFKVSNMDIASLLYKKGAIISFKNRFNEDLFEFGNKDFKEEALVRFTNKDEYISKYPLHYYILSENLKMIIEYKKDCYLNIKDNLGYYPKDLAFFVNNDEIIKLL